MSRTGGPQVALEGDKALMKVFRDMKGPVGRRVMRSSLQSGLTIIAREARKRAPGNNEYRFRDMIGTKVKTTSKRNVLGYVYVKEHGADTVTVEGREVDLAVAANFVEFGTPTAKAHSFIRAARAAKGGQALAAVKAKASVRIDVEWKKAHARHRAIWK